MAATIYEPLSTAHLKSCTVDFDSRPDKKAVNLVQYDQTIPVLCVSLKKSGTEYKVPSDADVNIRMDKRDGYHVYNPALGVNAERTIAYFAVTPQMSTGWGDYYPIVEITVGGGIAGSAPIWLHFDRNPLPENAIISSDEYKTIQQLLEDVTAVKAATEQIKAQTEAVRDQAKGFADNAKNSADKAQTLVDGMPSDYSQAMKDIGTLKNQMQRAYPDDSTIGDKPWSSKHIIDMLFPPLEESGNPVVCYPVAGYPLGVKASWEPVQEGTGTPYPAGGGKNLWGDLIQNTFVSQQGFSSGYSGAKTTGKIPCSEGDDYTLSCATSFAAAPGNIGVLAYFDASDTMLTSAANTYQRAFTLKAPANAAYLRASCYKETDADNVQLEKGSTATAYSPYANIRPIKGRDSVTVERCGENLLPFGERIENVYTQLIMTSDDLLILSKACAGQNITLTFSIETQNIVFDDVVGEEWRKRIGFECHGTLADGTETWSLQCWLDNRTGELTKNGKKTKTVTVYMPKLLNGDITFYAQNIKSGSFVAYDFGIYAGTTAPTTYTPYIGQTTPLTLPETVYGGEVDAVSGESSRTWRTITLTGEESSHIYSTLFYIDLYKDSSFVQEKAADATTGKSSHYKYHLYVSDCIGIAVDGGSIAYNSNGKYPLTDEGMQEWKAYLAAQYAAGTPVQIAYKLATPTPFTATGAQPLPALAGANTVLTDADSATVTGRADPIKRITDLEDAVASQT